MAVHNPSADRYWPTIPGVALTRSESPLRSEQPGAHDVAGDLYRKIALAVGSAVTLALYFALAQVGTPGPALGWPLAVVGGIAAGVLWPATVGAALWSAILWALAALAG